MDSILADEPSVHTLPEGPEDEAASAEPEAPSEAGETPVVEAKGDAKPPVKGDEDGEDADLDPKLFNAEGARVALKKERTLRREAEKSRKAFERELAELKGQVTALRDKPQTQAPKPAEKTQADLEAEYFADPVGFTRKHGADLSQSFDQKLTQARINTSEVYARRTHADYDEKMTAFVQMAQREPHLWKQMAADQDPAGFAYQKAADHMEFQAWRDARTAAPAQEQHEPTPKPAKPPIPKTNANARGSGAGATREWSGPRSTEQLFGRGR